MQRKSLIFVVISVLVVALVHSSYSGFEAFAVPRDPNYIPNEKCMPNMDGTRLTCCWDEADILNPGEFIHWCQSCDFDGGNCGEVYSQSPQPSGPAAPLQDGVLEQPPTPPTPPLSPDMPTLETVPPNRTLPGGDIPTLEAVPPETGTMEQRAPGTSPPPQSAACYPNCPPPPPPPPPPNHVVQQTPPSAPAAPLKGGNLEQLEQGDGAAPPFVPGFLERQQLQPPPAEQGAAELPPPTEETQPATVEEEQSVPVCQEGLEFNEDLGFCVPTECPEGQELNEETGICVLEEQPAAAQEPEEQQQTGEEQPQPEEEQPSQESDSEEDNGNN